MKPTFDPTQCVLPVNTTFLQSRELPYGKFNTAVRHPIPSAHTLKSATYIYTKYWLHGLGFETRQGRDFPLPSRLALMRTQRPAYWVRVSLPGVKRPGRGLNHPSPYSAEVKERVEYTSISRLGLHDLS